MLKAANLLVLVNGRRHLTSKCLNKASNLRQIHLASTFRDRKWNDARTPVLMAADVTKTNIPLYNFVAVQHRSGKPWDDDDADEFGDYSYQRHGNSRDASYQRRGNSWDNSRGRNRRYQERSFGQRRNRGYSLNYDPEEDNQDDRTPPYNRSRVQAHELEDFEKNFYRPTSAVAERSPEDVASFIASNDITVDGEDAPNPILAFDECDMPTWARQRIEREGWNTMTPIQSMSLPLALSGQNMVGLSRTGSGKTFAFLLPALIHIQNQPPVNHHEGPIALVLAPTRELVQQISAVARSFCKSARISHAEVYGGASRGQQLNVVSRGVQLCVATPGRLIDFLQSGVISMNRCTYLVLDEADRMLDMGFEPQIRQIISEIREDRQTLMFSATWPVEVRNLAYDFLAKFTTVTVGSRDLVPNENISQNFVTCNNNEKKEKLVELLQEILEDKSSKLLIFTGMKRTADFISFYLNKYNIDVDATHGDKSQRLRDEALRRFRSGQTQVLVATDVAARGIDVADITHVINYDMPNTCEDYVHRIGRTARHNKSGTSYSFVTDEDSGMLNKLVRMLKRTNQPISQELMDIAGSNYSSKGSRNSFSGNRPRRFSYKY